MSQIIRDYVEKNPGLGPTQVARDLEAQGHKAYPALVSQALRSKTAKGKKRATKRGRKSTVAKKVGGSDLNLAALKAVSDFVKANGSAEDAIASIRQFQKLSAMFE